MSKTIKVTVELTKAEAEAAFVAASNYTPAKGKPWKQAAQSRAAVKLSEASRHAYRIAKANDRAAKKLPTKKRVAPKRSIRRAVKRARVRQAAKR